MGKNINQIEEHFMSNTHQDSQELEHEFVEIEPKKKPSLSQIMRDDVQNKRA
jgi:hypothetical protein